MITEKEDLSNLFWIVVFTIFGGVVVAIIFWLLYIGTVYGPLTVLELIFVFLSSIPELQILLGILVTIFTISYIFKRVT